MPTLPTWWPPAGSHEITETQVRELFTYLRTVVPPVMANARRRIQDRVGDDLIQVWPTTVTDLTTLAGTPEHRQQEWVTWQG